MGRPITCFCGTCRNCKVRAHRALVHAQKPAKPPCDCGSGKCVRCFRAAEAAREAALLTPERRAWQESLNKTRDPRFRELDGLIEKQKKRVKK